MTRSTHRVTPPPTDEKSMRAVAEGGAAWAALGRWASQLASLGTFVIVARNVEKSEVGLAAVTLSILYLLQVLADAGVANYLIQGRREEEADLSTAFWLTMILGSALAGILVVGSPTVESVIGIPGLARTVPWIALSLLLIAASSVPTALLSQRLEFRSLALRQVLATAAGSAVAVTLAVLGFGVWALIVQSLVFNFVSMATVFLAARWYPKWELRRDRLGRMASFGSKSASIAVLVQVRDRLEDFLLGGFLGAAAVGTWSVSNRIPRIVSDLTNSIIQGISLPLFARVSADRERLERAFSRMLGLSLGILGPACAGVALVAPNLLTAALGDQWQSAVVPAQIISVTTIIAAMSSYDRTFYMAIARPGLELVMTILFVGIAAVVIIFAAPHGPVVLALAALVRTAVLVPTRMVALVTFGNIRMSAFRQPVFTLFVVLGSGFVSYAIAVLAFPDHQVAQVATKVVLFTGLYFLGLWALARPTFDDLYQTVFRVLSGRFAR